jgi:hypothetical protein
MIGPEALAEDSFGPEPEHQDDRQADQDLARRGAEVGA